MGFSVCKLNSSVLGSRFILPHTFLKSVISWAGRALQSCFDFSLGNEYHAESGSKVCRGFRVHRLFASCFAGLLEAPLGGFRKPSTRKARKQALNFPDAGNYICDAAGSFGVLAVRVSDSLRCLVRPRWCDLHMGFEQVQNPNLGPIDSKIILPEAGRPNP